MADTLERRLDEFDRHLWNHRKNPLLKGLDCPNPIKEEYAEALTNLADRANKDDVDGVKKLIDKYVRLYGEEFILLMLQLTGSTRSKIITDLKVEASGVTIPTKLGGLPGSRAWPLALDYLASSLIFVLGPVGRDLTPSALEAISRATWPGYIRQEKAKRGGHAGEQKLALALKGCGIPFVPEEKSDNPMCRDTQICGESFDIVVPNEKRPLVCFKSTVHTANIGQYGESKDHLEITEAKKALESLGDHRPVLMALADGVGLKSNIAGLKGVLENADECCQFTTIWKAVVVAAHELGYDDLEIYLPESEFRYYDDFLNKYGIGKEKRLSSIPADGVEVGDAWIRRKNGKKIGLNVTVDPIGPF